MSGTIKFQNLVQMIVKKAYGMSKQMNIPVLGIVENYSYVKCPDCGKELKVFGESHIEEIAAELGVPVLSSENSCAISNTSLDESKSVKPDIRLMRVLSAQS